MNEVSRPSRAEIRGIVILQLLGGPDEVYIVLRDGIVVDCTYIP